VHGFLSSSFCFRPSGFVASSGGELGKFKSSGEKCVTEARQSVCPAEYRLASVCRSGVVTPSETRVAESAGTFDGDTLIVATPPVVLRILMIRPSGSNGSGSGPVRSL